MIIYEGTKSDFHKDVRDDIIDKRIRKQFYEKLQREVSPNEERSWRNSMGFVDRVLDDIEIPSDSGIAIEFKVPYTSKRIDFIISGKNEEGVNAAVIIELKQWESIDIVRDKDGVVRTYLGGGTSTLNVSSIASVAASSSYSLSFLYFLFFILIYISFLLNSFPYV